MTTTAKIRMEQSDYDVIQAHAKSKSMSMSDLVRQAMQPYVSGKKQLHGKKKQPRETTVIVDDQELEVFRALASEANVSIYEAFRVAIENYMRERT